MILGGPAVVITPGVPALMVAAGRPKFVVLVELKNSERNCSLFCSENRKSLNRPRSQLNSRGPRTTFRPELPIEKGPCEVGATKQLVSNQRSLVGFDNLPLQTRSGRDP